MKVTFFREKIQEWFSFLEVEKNVSQYTLKAYKSDLSAFITFWERLERDESEIDHAVSTVVQRYILSLFYKKIAKTTLARKLSALRSLQGYLHGKGINLGIEVKSPRIEKKLPIIFSVDEISYLLDSVKNEDLPTKYPHRDKALFELLYATGARCSEIVNIKMRDINFDERSILIRGKGNRDRYVLFGKKAQAAIEAYVKKERPALARFKQREFLFLNFSGNKITSRSVQRIFEMFRKFLKIDRKLTPHKLRHSFATHMLNQGVDLRVIKELLGHKTLATTEIYTHVSSAELAAMCDEKHPLSITRAAKKKGND